MSKSNTGEIHRIIFSIMDTFTRKFCIPHWGVLISTRNSSLQLNNNSTHNNAMWRIKISIVNFCIPHWRRKTLVTPSSGICATEITYPRREFYSTHPIPPENWKRHFTASKSVSRFEYCFKISPTCHRIFFRTFVEIRNSVFVTYEKTNGFGSVTGIQFYRLNSES